MIPAANVGGSDAEICPGGRRCCCDGQTEEVPDELASGRCGSRLGRSVRSRTSLATWTSTRRRCGGGCDRPRPIAAAGAMPLSVSGIIPSRLPLEQDSSWVGPEGPPAPAAAELTYATADSPITGRRHRGPPAAATKTNAESRSQDRVKRAASFAIRDPSGRQPGISTLVASEAGRNPPKLGALQLAKLGARCSRSERAERERSRIAR